MFYDELSTVVDGYAEICIKEQISEMDFVYKIGCIMKRRFWVTA